VLARFGDDDTRTRTVIELRLTPLTFATSSTISPSLTASRKSIRSERAVTTARPAKRLATRNAALSIHASACPPNSVPR